MEPFDTVASHIAPCVALEYLKDVSVVVDETENKEGNSRNMFKLLALPFFLLY